MTKLNKTLQFIILFVFAVRGIAQNSGVEISSQVDKSRITIGDLIVYSVKMIHPAKIEVDMPGPAANLGGFEIRDYNVKKARREGSRIISEAEYVISTFLTGEFVIPPLTLYYRIPGDSVVKSISTGKIKIIVESLKASEAGDIRDIKPPKEISRDWRTIILLSSLGLLLLLMIIAGIIIHRRRKAGQSLLPVKTAPPRPPHEIAFENLQKLEAAKLPEQGKIKQYYIEISDIIRVYIEGRYYLTALEMTTFEVLHDLKGVDIQLENHDLIRTFLESADLVKFAKKNPADKENEEIMQNAREIIDRTKIASIAPEVSGMEISDQNSENVRDAEDGEAQE